MDTAPLGTGPEPADPIPASGDDYLAMAVHELRQPAMVMIASVDTLLHLWDDASCNEGQGRAVVERLGRTARHLARLVDDLLSRSFLDRGLIAVDSAAVPIAPILGFAVDAALANERGATATIECRRELHALADADRLEQVLTNLVANAIQHGAPPIEVAAWEDGDQVRVAVRDHGPGVATGDSRDLFTSFGRVPRRTLRSNGLGLSVARDMARAMGGDVVYEPIDASARFVVTLPRPPW